MKNREPLFLRFINKEVGVSDLLSTFARSGDPYTAETATAAMGNPPNLDEFLLEITEATRDIIRSGIGDEFKAFVNHYMMDSIAEDIESGDTPQGQNISRTARVRDADTPWVQGLLCYNLCLYVKAYGLQDLKICKICNKFFAHKGQYALYCSDACKKQGKAEKKPQEPTALPPMMP